MSVSTIPDVVFEAQAAADAAAAACDTPTPEPAPAPEPEKKSFGEQLFEHLASQSAIVTGRIWTEKELYDICKNYKTQMMKQLASEDLERSYRDRSLTLLWDAYSGNLTFCSDADYQALQQIMHRIDTNYCGKLNQPLTNLQTVICEEVANTPQREEF
jgi:hypothetical protein